MPSGYNKERSLAWRLTLNTDIMKAFEEYTKEEIINRLKYDYEFEQDGVDSETWIDPITQKKYYVPIEIVRDFDNLEEII